MNWPLIAVNDTDLGRVGHTDRFSNAGRFWPRPWTATTSSQSTHNPWKKSYTCPLDFSLQEKIFHPGGANVLKCN
jgi:hypothetical protein